MTDSTAIDRFPAEIDETTVQQLQTFVRDVVERAGVDGVVVNLSGGLDSTVTATLATEALGSDRVTGLILPTADNRDQNVIDARQIAEELAIDHREIHIQRLVDQIARAVTGDVREQKSHPMAVPKRVTSSTGERENLEEAVGNAAARVRMALAYFEANTTSKLVLGTGNRTELLLGYFTKFGDGGVDALPIGDLYKTEVRTLARRLDVRDRIVEKEPTAGLWAGQTDESELGAAYETIDPILHHHVDRGRDASETAELLDVSEETVKSFADMYRESVHKRRTPPTPASLESGERTFDWSRDPRA